MPATQEGFSAALILQVTVIAVEVFLTVRDAYHTRRQGCPLADIAHGLGITWREYVNITVVSFPDSLVILGFEAAAGITDFVCLDELLCRHGGIIKNCHPTLVGVLRPLQLTFLVSAAVGTAVFGLYQRLVTRQYILTAVYGSAILAQPHGNGCAVYLFVMFQNTRQCHELTVAQEILGHIGFYFRIIGFERFGRYIQIREQEHFRQILLVIGILRRAVAGRGGDDILVVDAVSGESLDGELSRTRLHFVGGVHDIRTGSSGITLIISQSIEILILIEHPLGSAVVDKSVVDGRNRAFVQSLGSQQDVSRITRGRDRGSDHKIAFGLIIISAARHFRIRTRCQCQSCHRGCEKSG